MGGGVTIYVHDSLKIIRELKTPFNDSFESLALELAFKGNHFIFCEYYRVPNSDDRLFLTCLNKIHNLSSAFNLSILCSDHNYDLLKMHLHRPTKDFVEQNYENGYVFTITKPTRVTHSMSTLIDNICVKNRTLNRHNTFVIVDGMSDH